uniref:Uncharacterized protein n=1 Tax=Melopsittacus undulatus TaxID=13146 RepID=A0A8V5GME0_MELUD
LPGTALLRGFRVSYKRHVLTMDDLQTLYGPNWLNDQGFVGGLYRGLGLDHIGVVGEGSHVMLSPLFTPPQVMNMYGDLVMDAVPDKVRGGHAPHNPPIDPYRPL